MADTYKFRIDHHGSLVRPPELLNARARHAAGTLDDEALRAAEDEAIRESARYQRQLHLTVVTDGDFRRADFRGAILETVSGFRRTDAADKYGRPRWEPAGEIKVTAPLTADDYEPVKAMAGQVALKASLPSPAFLAATCWTPGGPYKTPAELGETLAQIIRDEIELLISGGVRLIQLNNYRYAAYLFSRPGQPLTLDEAIAIDSNAADVTKPEDARIALCPTHKATDAVDTTAATHLFAALPIDRWVLPYDKGTEQELDLLRAVPTDRDAALGIVDPTVPDLEDVETIMQRMDAAADLKDMEDLAVTPSAGFSDTAAHAAVTLEAQRRKLVHVETIARMCWGNEL